MALPRLERVKAIMKQGGCWSASFFVIINSLHARYHTMSYSRLHLLNLMFTCLPRPAELLTLAQLHEQLGVTGDNEAQLVGAALAQSSLYLRGAWVIRRCVLEILEIFLVDDHVTLMVQ
jgi:hypothetical protein